MKTLAFGTLLLASLLQAQTEPAGPALFPADRDGAPAPLAPLEGGSEGRKGPPREFGGGQVVRDKVAQLKEAGITREDMQKIRAALEKAREDDAVKVAREKADAAQEKLRAALRAYAESKGIEIPDAPFARKFRPEPGKDKSEQKPEQGGERRARKGQEGAPAKPEISQEKMAEVRKVMEGARNDPAVKAAFEESRAAGDALREAVHAAMLKSDPSLAPLIDKLGDLREVFRAEHLGLGGDKGFGFPGEKQGGPGMEKPRSPKLNAALEAAYADETIKAARKAAEEAKAKLNAALQAYAEAHGLKADKGNPESIAAYRKAMEEARNDPAVKAAHDAARAAGDALHEAIRAFVLNFDPSLASEFDKPAPVKSPKGENPAPVKSPKGDKSAPIKKTGA